MKATVTKEQPIGRVVDSPESNWRQFEINALCPVRYAAYSASQKTAAESVLPYVAWVAPSEQTRPPKGTIVCDGATFVVEPGDVDKMHSGAGVKAKGEHWICEHMGRFVE